MSSSGFGIITTLGADAARAPLAELCEWMSRATGVTFTPHTFRKYGDLAAALENGTIGLSWMPPIPALDLKERRAAQVLALPARAGKTSYHAALFVRPNGPRSIAELRGLRVAWVDRASSSGYLVPRMHLMSRGIDVDSFFGREAFLRSHAAVVDAVAAGDADVGATFCAVDLDANRVASSAWTTCRGVPIRSVTAMETIGPIPNDAIVAGPSLPSIVRANVARWLFELQGRPLRLFHDLMQAEGFRVASDLHFEPLRHMMRAARARGFEPASALFRAANAI